MVSKAAVKIASKFDNKLLSRDCYSAWGTLTPWSIEHNVFVDIGAIAYFPLKDHQKY